MMGTSPNVASEWTIPWDTGQEERPMVASFAKASPGGGGHSLTTFNFDGGAARRSEVWSLLRKVQ
jgi:hypothetical protein